MQNNLITSSPAIQQAVQQAIRKNTFLVFARKVWVSASLPGDQGDYFLNFGSEKRVKIDSIEIYKKGSTTAVALSKTFTCKFIVEKILLFCRRNDIPSGMRGIDIRLSLYNRVVEREIGVWRYMKALIEKRWEEVELENTDEEDTDEE